MGFRAVDARQVSVATGTPYLVVIGLLDAVAVGIVYRLSGGCGGGHRFDTLIRLGKAVRDHQAM
jgi:hypothetical protein